MKTKVLVIFGSKSDESIYQPLLELLSGNFITDFAILSAHRNYRELEERLVRKDFDLVVAGAGLSAHLPGVIAAQVQVPVVGIPVASRLGGLDAYFSISQMPKGVPVLATFPEALTQAVEFLKMCTQQNFAHRLNLVCKDLYWQYEYSAQFFEDAKNGATQANIEWHTSKLPVENCLNVFVITEPQDFIQQKCINGKGIYVPMMEPLKAKSSTRALEIFEWARNYGPWVGLNNFSNAIKMAEKIFCFQQKIF